MVSSILFLSILCELCFGYIEGDARRRTVSWQDNQFDGMALRIQLDEDLFIPSPCSASVVPVFKGCNTEPDGDGKSEDYPACLDGTSLVNNMTFYNVTQAWAKISLLNYQTCTDRVALSILPVLGVSQAFVYFGDQSYLLYSTVTPRNITKGVMPFAFCCQELRTMFGPSWDGSLYFYLSSSTTFLQAQFLTPVTRNLDPMYFPQLVNLDVTCPRPLAPRTDGDPIMIFPADPPNLGFWVPAMLNYVGANFSIEYPLLGRVLVAILWIYQTEPNTRVPDNDFGVGYEFGQSIYISTYNCTVTFSNLVDGQGVPSVLEVVPVSSFGTCSYESFASVADGFNRVVAFLENQTNLASSDAVLGLRDLGLVFLNTTQFDNCNRLARSFLDESNSTTMISTQTCGNIPGTQAWQEDPCCNPAMALYSCCVSTPQAQINVSFSVPDDIEDVVAGSCIAPGCVIQPAVNLNTILNSYKEASCQEQRLEAFADPRFVGDYFSYCKGRVYSTYCGFSSDCTSIDAASVCDASLGVCSIPCSNGTCYNGKCVDNQCVLNVPTDDDFRDSEFFRCISEMVDPFLRVLINSELVRRGANPDKLYVTFIEAITSNECVTPSGIQVEGIDTEEECSAYEGYCPWLYCRIGGNLLNGLPCTKEICLANLPAPSCVYNFSPDYIVYPVGRPPLCELRVDDTGLPNLTLNESLCESFGGIFAGPDYSQISRFGPCLSNRTEASCYDPDQCIPTYKGGPCVSYCYNSNALTSTACIPASPSGRFNQTYYSWLGSSGVQGRCVIEANYSDCISEDNGVWQTGYRFLSPWLNSPEECDIGCWNQEYRFRANISISDCPLYDCTSCFTGNEPSCNNKTQCLQETSCNAPKGCRFVPDIDQLLGFDIPCYWTPDWCVLRTSPALCYNWPSTIADGYQRFANFSTEAECLAEEVCWDGTGSDFVPDDPTSLPSNINYRNATECTKCGGTMISTNRWKQSRWIPYQYPVQLTWLNSEIITASWRPVLSNSSYFSLLEKSKTIRLASIVASELLCNGVESEAIGSIAYACDSGNQAIKDTSSLESLSGSTVSFLYACVSVISDSHIGPLNISVTSDFSFTQNSSNVGDVPCIKARINLLPLSQFNFTDRAIGTSLMLVSETYRSTQTPKYVYNDNAVVVGLIATDGVSIQYVSNQTFVGINLCLDLPDPATVGWDLINGYYEWDMVEALPSTVRFFDFKPLGLHVDISARTICIPLTGGENKTYFAALLIENWENITIPGAWKSTERGLIIFCTVLYFILFFFSLMNLVLHLIEEKWKRFPGPELALLCVCILAALGAAQLLSVYVGTVTGPELSPLLSDLQSLMLISCVVLIVITWSRIITSGKKLHTSQASLVTPLVFLLVLYMLFIALLVASAATEEVIKYTCATTQAEKDALTTSQQLALAYKACLACWAFLLSVGFTWMSYEVYVLLHSYTKLEKVVYKNLIASVSVIFSLLVLVAITLYSTQYELENTTKLAFVIMVLILPSYSITYLYSKGSTFSTWTKWSSGKSKPTSTTPSSLSSAATRGSDIK